MYPGETVLPSGCAWIDTSGEWATKTITTEPNQIEIGYDYPECRGRTLGGAAVKVDRYIKAYVDDSIRGFVDETPPQEPSVSTTGWFFQASFSVSLIRASLVSVRCTRTSYTGGAHGAHWTEVQNLLTAPVRSLNIEDLLADPAAGITALSTYAIKGLLEPDAGACVRDERWVREGAGPEPRNVKAFNLTSRGILLTFDEYQVGSYAEGTSEIHVPYEVVAGLFHSTLAADVFGHDA